MKNSVKESVKKEIKRMVEKNDGFISKPVIIANEYRLIGNQIFLIDNDEEKEYVPQKWHMEKHGDFVKIITDHHIYFAAA